METTVKKQNKLEELERKTKEIPLSLRSGNLKREDILRVKMPLCERYTDRVKYEY